MNCIDNGADTRRNSASGINSYLCILILTIVQGSKTQFPSEYGQARPHLKTEQVEFSLRKNSAVDS